MQKTMKKSNNTTPNLTSIGADLLRLLNYCSETEEKHWEESGKPKNHIYVSIRRLKQFLFAIKLKQAKKKLNHKK